MGVAEYLLEVSGENGCNLDPVGQGSTREDLNWDSKLREKKNRQDTIIFGNLPDSQVKRYFL